MEQLRQRRRLRTAIISAATKCSAGSNFSDEDRHHLASLAKLTASLLQVHSLAQRSTHAFVQVEAQLAHQLQILDQIQESVLTLDQTGYITSWNKGAERLFGYTALEAIGNHILFLYVDEDAGFHDGFAEQGGRMMEVRRRKKSGEVFWASMTLTPLCDADERPIGLIAYLTDITERKQAEERLHHLAYYDALTSLPNRTLLTKLVDQALMVAQRNDSSGCVLFIDLNRFKWINDTLGRRIGDELLRQVSLRFRGALREEDIVARLSGDEFVVGLFDIRQHFEATTVAQKLQASLVEPFLIEGHDLRVGASIGISVYPQDGGDAETLLRLADIAMARAKLSQESPEDSVAFYSLDMNQGMHERMRIEIGPAPRAGQRRTAAALPAQVRDRRRPHHRRRSAGALAASRARHGAAGRIHPAGRNDRTDRASGRVGAGSGLRAGGDLAAGGAAAVPHRDQRVGARIYRGLAGPAGGRPWRAIRLEPCWLELEITESALMHDIERVIAIMDQINALGVTLSLDDFGTGYSSLSYLKRFPIQTLKIDRSFTTGLPGDSSDCAIATTIISIGRQLKHKVIAEGVETVEQLEFLRESGLR